MKRLAAALVAAAALMSWANPNAQAAPDQRVIITFKQGTSEQARAQALQALGATPVSVMETNGRTDKEFTLVVANSSMALDQAPKLADVASIEPDFRVKWIESTPESFQATPFNIGASLSELGLHKLGSLRRAASFHAAALRPEIPWGVNRVHAPAAWDYTEGAGVRVAVIDTGIDSTHPDLAGKVDGGYSAIQDSEAPDTYQDDNGHGTHVAGTIAASRNGKGVVGVAPRARLYAVKVLDSDGSGSLSDVIKGIIWCANNGIQVANMSLGAPQGSDAMERALRYAKARGVVVVAAAGNSGGAVGYPGAYPEVIAVSASDWNDHIAAFSSRGPEVDFIAPGVDILSTQMGGDYITMSGTSMATPHVTGLAALAVSQGYRGMDGPDGVFAQLKKAATPLPGLDPTEQGYGMIDAGKLTRMADVASAQ